jgi:hypothetical protein
MIDYAKTSGKQAPILNLYFSIVFSDDPTSFLCGGCRPVKSGTDLFLGVKKELLDEMRYAER